MWLRRRVRLLHLQPLRLRQVGQETQMGPSASRPACYACLHTLEPALAQSPPPPPLLLRVPPPHPRFAPCVQSSTMAASTTALGPLRLRSRQRVYDLLRCSLHGAAPAAMEATAARRTHLALCRTRAYQLRLLQLLLSHLLLLPSLQQTHRPLCVCLRHSRPSCAPSLAKMKKTTTTTRAAVVGVDTARQVEVVVVVVAVWPLR